MLITYVSHIEFQQELWVLPVTWKVNLPIPVTERYKVLVCDSTLVEVLSSNPAAVWTCASFECCQNEVSATGW